MLKKDHEEYKNWLSMKSRVWMRTGLYKDVDMDPNWLDFYMFLEDVGLKPAPHYTLDRIKRSIGYWPGNVRWATCADQQVNRGTPKNNKSGYRGVCYRSKGNLRWRANICYGGKRKEIGLFKTAKEAAKAYNVEATRLHGEFAQLNKI